MMNPNKDRVTTIVASIGRDKNGNTEGREEFKKQDQNVSDSTAAKEAAMDSFLISIDKKDSRGMARAMKTFMELCEYGGEEEGEPAETGSSNNPYKQDNRDKNPYQSGY